MERMHEYHQLTTRRFFHQFFPPPKFLEMPAVGLSISDSAVSAVELSRERDSFAVRRFARRVLPAGVISGGYINDKDRLLALLKEIKSEVKTCFVNLSLSEEKAYLFKVLIPFAPRNDTRGIIDLMLEEHVPLKASEAVFDYVVVNETEREPGGHCEVVVTALPQKTAEIYSALVRSAGFIPLSLELDAQAAARAVVREGDRDAYLIANVGESRTGLFIVSEGTVHFTSSVAVGGQQITAAIAKHLSVEAAEAESIKKERTAVADGKNARLFLSFMNTLSVLKDETNKLLLYWHTHQEADGGGKKIKKIILCGRDAGLSGFDDYFSFALSLPVEIANVWRNVCSFDEYIPPIPFADSLDYAAAVGLALPRL